MSGLIRLSVPDAKVARLFVGTPGNAGDLLAGVGGATAEYAPFPVGTADQFLRSTGTGLAWTAISLADTPGSVGTSLITDGSGSSLAIRPISVSGSLGISIVSDSIRLNSPGITTTGTGVTLVAAGDHILKGLSAGSAISLTNNASDIVINSTLLSSAGGTTLVSNSDHVLKGLVAGNAIALSNNASTVTIASTAITTTGTGATLVAAGDHVLKGLSAGTSVSLTNNASNIVINSTGLTPTATGTASLVAAGDHVIRRITQGAGITVTEGVDDVVIAATASSPVSLADQGVTGTSLITDGAGPDLLIRRIGVSGSLAITVPITDELLLSSPGLTTTGTGETLVAAGDHQLKGLLAGSSITLNSNLNRVRIDSTNLSSAGGAVTMVATGDHLVKGLTAGTSVSLTNNATNVVINSTSLTSTATGTASLVVTGSDHVIRRITQGTGITVTQGTDDVVISANVLSLRRYAYTYRIDPVTDTATGGIGNISVSENLTRFTFYNASSNNGHTLSGTNNSIITLNTGGVNNTIQLITYNLTVKITALERNIVFQVNQNSIVVIPMTRCSYAKNGADGIAEAYCSVVVYGLNDGTPIDLLHRSGRTAFETDGTVEIYNAYFSVVQLWPN